MKTPPERKNVRLGHLHSTPRRSISRGEWNGLVKISDHELGHSFENALEKIYGKGNKPPRQLLDKLQSTTSFPDRPVPPDDEDDNERGEDRGGGYQQPPDNNTWGFAGPYSSRYLNAWQQSRDPSPGEEFADMYIGWVYSTWETDSRGKLTEEGKARSDFMIENMPYWVMVAYER